MAASSEPREDSSLDPSRMQALSAPEFSLQNRRIKYCCFQPLSLYFATSALESISVSILHITDFNLIFKMKETYFPLGYMDPAYCKENGGNSPGY